MPQVVNAHDVVAHAHDCTRGHTLGEVNWCCQSSGTADEIMRPDALYGETGTPQ